MAFDVLSFVIGKAAGSASGGGAVEGVHFVTFMSEDGSTELYKRPVADGDDCADPVERGYIPEPTKESTAQYSYTYMGWATEPNGGVNSTALSAVTADKTVYANFASVLRYYTITYYDDDGTTVLKTESLAYGTTPVYMADKEGYSFDGWTPALATVTGDASYVAQFSEELTFAAASWADIARISEAGEAVNYFAVGDTKEIAFNGETITVAIAGFNHDDLSDGSGKAGMSIVCTKVPTITTPFSTVESLYNESEVNAKLTEWKAMLPTALATVIKPVLKVCDASVYSANKDVTSHSFDLWALSCAEYGWTTTNNAVVTLGSTYTLYQPTKTGTLPYADSGTFPKIKAAGITSYIDTWSRNMNRRGSGGYSAAYFTNTGAKAAVNQPSTTAYYILFGFCV